MQSIFYYATLLLIKCLQALPLTAVAVLGRAGGGFAYWIDARHRRVTLRNLALSFPEWKEAQVRAVAREHFRRLGENYACAIKLAVTPAADLANHFHVTGTENVRRKDAAGLPVGGIVAVGHFGNFELYARIKPYFPDLTLATTYRPLKQPRLNKLLVELRAKSGCHFFDRRGELGALREYLRQHRMLVGLLADQHSGRSGVRLPFFGRECSTNTAVAVLAQRYGLPLYTAICFRTGLARWHIEFGDEIVTHVEGNRRSVVDIMADVNAAFEIAIRRDPANWFWVHDRWKDRRSGGTGTAVSVKTATLPVN